MGYSLPGLVVSLVQTVQGLVNRRCTLPPHLIGPRTSITSPQLTESMSQLRLRRAPHPNPEAGPFSLGGPTGRSPQPLFCLYSVLDWVMCHDVPVTFQLEMRGRMAPAAVLLPRVPQFRRFGVSG